MWDAAIALAIIDAIDESGYLTATLEDIQAAVSSEEVEVELDEIEAVLKRVQHFDPVGIAARSVQECLLIQLGQYSPDLPWLDEAREVIREHMDLLGNRDYRTLARKTRLKESDLKEVLDLIQQLEPRPGNGIIQSESQYVIPDVSVVKKGSKWVVELNPDSAPRIPCQRGLCGHGAQCPQQHGYPVHPFSFAGGQVVHQEPGES